MMLLGVLLHPLDVHKAPKQKNRSFLAAQTEKTEPKTDQSAKQNISSLPTPSSSFLDGMLVVAGLLPSPLNIMSGSFSF